jgi:hypothetical protein
MKLTTEDEKRMWREAYCAALTGILSSGHTPNQNATKEAAAMANYSIEHWQTAAKDDA